MPTWKKLKIANPPVITDTKTPVGWDLQKNDTPKALNQEKKISTNFFLLICFMFFISPVRRLSTQMTKWPFSRRKSQRWDPIKPAPPVMRIFMVCLPDWILPWTGLWPGSRHPRFWTLQKRNRLGPPRQRKRFAGDEPRWHSPGRFL